MLYIIKQNYLDQTIASHYILNCYVPIVPKIIKSEYLSQIDTTNTDHIWAFDIDQVQLNSLLHKQYNKLIVIGTKELQIPIEHVGKSVTVINSNYCLPAIVYMLGQSIVDGSLFGYNYIDNRSPIQNDFLRLLNDALTSQCTKFKDSLPLLVFLENSYKRSAKKLLQVLNQIENKNNPAHPTYLELAINSGKNFNLCGNEETINLINKDRSIVLLAYVTTDPTYYIHGKNYDCIKVNNKIYVHQKYKEYLKSSELDYNLTKYTGEKWYKQL